jgi:hypothetical protein
MAKNTAHTQHKLYAEHDHKVTTQETKLLIFKKSKI